MHHDPPFAILAVSTVIADLIVGAMGVALCGSLAYMAHSRAKTMLAMLGPGEEEEMTGAAGILLGIVSFVFWPCALVLSILFLQKPKTARVGRLCAFGGIGYLVMSFVLGIVLGDALILSGLLVV